MRIIPEHHLEIAKRSYEEQGVCVIHGVFDKQEIDALRTLAWNSFKVASEAHIQYKNGSPALLFSPKYLQKYTEAIRPIVQSFLGDRVVQLNRQYYFRLPGDGDEFAWHQDISFRIPADKFRGIESGYLQTAIIVDKQTDKNGGIEFVIGSHKQGELNLIPRDGSEDGLRKYDNKFSGVVFAAEPGDVMLWSVMTVHGSKQNNSDSYRSYYMNGFAKEECVDPSLGFPRY